MYPSVRASEFLVLQLICFLCPSFWRAVQAWVRFLILCALGQFGDSLLRASVSSFVNGILTYPRDQSLESDSGRRQNTGSVEIFCNVTAAVSPPPTSAAEQPSPPPWRRVKRV